MIPDNRDAFGHAILDYHEGRHVDQAGEFGCHTWFSRLDDWLEREKQAIGHARGTVLDIGCAAGRHALYLQQCGHDVVAIDSSPPAVRVCRERGVRRAMTLSVTELGYRLG